MRNRSSTDSRGRLRRAPHAPRGRATATVLAGFAVAGLVCASPSLATTNVITRYAGNGTSALPVAGPAVSSPLRLDDFDGNSGAAVDSSGNVYIADTFNDDVEKVTPGGQLSIIAGNGTGGAPTAGPATSSHLDQPEAVAVDSSGNVYIADQSNNDVEQVTPGGQLSIIAGKGTSGAPTAGTATNSHLNAPQGVAVDSSGNVYIADTGNDDVEEVTSGGQLSIVVGEGSSAAPTYGGSPLASRLEAPGGVAVDSSGVLYIADTGHDTVDRVGPATPAAPTIASTSIGTTSATLSFNVVSVGTSQITGYQISTNDGTTWQSATTSSGSGTQLQTTLTGLTPGSTYMVLIRAQNTTGAGAASSADSVVIPLPTTTTTTTTATTTATATTSTSASVATTAVATATLVTTTATASVPAPDSVFDAMHGPYVNTTTGAISIYDTTRDPGRLTWRALYRHPGWLTYGDGSTLTSGAGITPFVISPGARARRLLRAERRHHGTGLPVAIVVTFQSAYGGPRVAHTETVMAALHVHRQ